MTHFTHRSASVAPERTQWMKSTDLVDQIAARQEITHLRFELSQARGMRDLWMLSTVLVSFSSVGGLIAGLTIKHLLHS